MSSRAFLRESTEINKGLMALDRLLPRVGTDARAAAADGSGGGWRRRARRRACRTSASMLTRVLRGCFEDGDHHTPSSPRVARGRGDGAAHPQLVARVLLMNPSLSSHSIEAEVPMTLGHRSYEGHPPPHTGRPRSSQNGSPPPTEGASRSCWRSARHRRRRAARDARARNLPGLVE